MLAFFLPLFNALINLLNLHCTLMANIYLPRVEIASAFVLAIDLTFSIIEMLLVSCNDKKSILSENIDKNPVFFQVRCMIEEYYDNGPKHGRAVNGNVNGDSRRNGITLTEFEELCANLKAQQVSLTHFYSHFISAIAERVEISDNVGR